MAEPLLAMNPFADIHVHPQPETYPIDVARIETITVRCPVRGRGVVGRDLTPAGDPVLFGFFAGLVARGGEIELDSDAALVPALVALGFLVVDDDIVDWPAFAVPLDAPDDPPGDPAAAADASWRVADGVVVQSAFALHPGLRWPVDYEEQDGRLRCFAPGPALWVGDPAALVDAYWLTADEARQIAPLVPGAAAPPLPPGLARSLAEVGALVPAGRPPLPPPGLARFGRARAAYAADGCAVVRGLVGARELAALRRYYAALFAAELVPLAGPHHTARHAAYNDPVGRFVHTRLTAAMSAVAGQPVEPAFSYLLAYAGGAALAPHKDRAEAEFSISLQIDHAPDTAGATGWPLWFRFDDGRRVAADLAIGDAVLYHGRAVTHHREVLPAGQRSTVLVLEYVPREFRGLRI